MGFLLNINAAVEAVLRGEKVSVLIEKDLRKMTIDEILELEQQGNLRFENLSDVKVDKTRKNTTTVAEKESVAVKACEAKKAQPSDDLHGIKRKKTIDIPKVIALKNAKWSNKEIAEEFGVAVGSISNILSKHKAGLNK